MLLKLVRAVPFTGQLLYIYLTNSEYEIELDDDDQAWSFNKIYISKLLADAIITLPQLQFKQMMNSTVCQLIMLQYFPLLGKQVSSCKYQLIQSAGRH